MRGYLRQDYSEDPVLQAYYDAMYAAAGSPDPATSPTDVGLPIPAGFDPGGYYFPDFSDPNNPVIYGPASGGGQVDIFGLPIEMPFEPSPFDLPPESQTPLEIQMSQNEADIYNSLIDIVNADLASGTVQSVDEALAAVNQSMIQMDIPEADKPGLLSKITGALSNLSMSGGGGGGGALPGGGSLPKATATSPTGTPVAASGVLSGTSLALIMGAGLAAFLLFGSKRGK